MTEIQPCVAIRTYDAQMEQETVTMIDGTVILSDENGWFPEKELRRLEEYGGELTMYATIYDAWRATWNQEDTEIN